MSWEPIEKLNSENPDPILRMARYKTGHADLECLQGNNAAAKILPSHVVILRDGERLAIRAATPEERNIIIRAASRRATGGLQIAAKGVAEPGQRFRIIPDGDLFLLEPMETKAPNDGHN